MATTKATNLGHRSDVTLKGTTTTVESNVVLSDTTTINNAGSDVGLKINSTSSGNIMQLQDGGTDVMVVADGGNVGIGGSGTPEAKLDVKVGSAGSVTAWTEADDLILESNAVAGISILTPDDSASRLVFGSPSSNQGAALFYRQNLNKMNVGTLQSGGALALRSGANVDAVVIDGNQNVGIGLTPSQGKLHISQTGTGNSSRAFFWSMTGGHGLGLYNDGSDNVLFGMESQQHLQFMTNAVARMTIDKATGHVAIGATPTSSYNLLVQDPSTHTFIGMNSPATSLASWFYINQNHTTSRGWLFGMEGGANNLRIFDRGDNSVAVHLNSGSSSWTANSDERLKKDIIPMENRLDDLLNIQVRRFKWKKNDRDAHGFIAQELVNYAPEAVDVGGDELVTKEESEASETLIEGNLKNPWGVSKESMIPMIIKSVQELSAKVTALENA